MVNAEPAPQLEFENVELALLFSQLNELKNLNEKKVVAEKTEKKFPETSALKMEKIVNSISEKIIACIESNQSKNLRNILPELTKCFGNEVFLVLQGLPSNVLENLKKGSFNETLNHSGFTDELNGIYGENLFKEPSYGWKSGNPV